VLELNRNGTWNIRRDYGEINIDRGIHLSRFIGESLREFTTKRAVLTFWDHGSGWPGFGGDSSAGGYSGMSLETMLRFTAEGLRLGGRERFDIVNWDACLMAAYTVTSAMAELTDFFLYSEELEPGHGLDWSWLKPARLAMDMIALPPKLNTNTSTKKACTHFPRKKFDSPEG